MPDRIRLDGKVAVVTGAAGVIGTATMRLLAERGARIVAVDRKAADLQRAVKDLPAAAQALAVPADVTSEDEVADYVRAAVDQFGTIDVFYNNAGIEGDVAPITKYSLEMFRKVIDVNVVGVFLVSVRRVLESYESSVIQEWWPDSRRGHRCGRARTAPVTTAASCDIRAI